MNIDILKSLNLTDEEEVFIRDSNTAITRDMNQSRVISDIYFVKKLEKVADETIESNEKLSKSNERYAKGMLYLTGALVFVGIVQIIVALIN
ncbi:hypothetical protein KAW50_04765 [candidate division WOR-3 bacterium]|nr:hypothetical protein [candidate division WOR-3 bacterium]